jgi:general secretion pathway protein M
VNLNFSNLSRHAIGAAAVYAVGFIVVVGGWLLSTNSNADLEAEIAAKQATLDKMMSRSVSDVLQGGAVEANPRALISAASETIAASTLQTYVLGKLEQAGGTVQSIQAESIRATPGESLHRLSSQVAFEGQIDQLQQLLFGLEIGTPFLFVDSLSIQPSSNVLEGTRMGDRLRVTMVVSGFWQIPPSIEGNQ